MKTLYISDLDGTLLNSDATLSADTVQGLNELISQGIHFSCATARTPATVSYILEDVTLSAPAVLMNGVVIYDLAQKEYIKIESLNPDAFTKLLGYMDEHNVSAFVYSIHENRLATYYDRLSNYAMEKFCKERITRYNKPFTKVDNFDHLEKNDIIYTLFLDTKEVLDPIYELILKLKEHYDIDVCYYLDVYFDDIYCLEVFSKKASKYNAVKYLREYYHYDRIIGFGDNLNDLSLFKACDEAYAVSNAKPEVRAAASAVIESNLENGVVHFISKHQRK